MTLSNRTGFQLVAGLGLAALVGCSSTGGGDTASTTLIAPAITAQPTDTTAVQGGSATFTVAAKGPGTLSYQWSKDGVDLAGATGLTLTVSNVQNANAGAYACKVTATLNGATASTTSASAQLAVNLTPTLNAGATQTMPQGSTVNLTVAATGDGTLTYQWYKNTVLLTGATYPTLTLTGLLASDAATYACVVTSTLNGTTTSARYTTVLAVALPPQITAQPPALQTLVQGDSLTLAVAATGAGTLSYQWLKDATPISGATSASLLLANVQGADAGTYACQITNTLNGDPLTVTSGATVLAVNLPAVITAQPAAMQTVPQGGSATLSVTATGNGTLSYQWTKGGVAITGATQSSLVFAALVPGDMATYACQVTNTLNGTVTMVTSANSVLAVNDAPMITTQPAAAQTAVENGSATFTVAAAGDGALSYQWTKGGAALPGQTAGTLALATVKPADAGTYACIVTDTLNGTVISGTSANAVLTVNAIPTFTAQPQASQTQVQGATATLAVAASGSGTLAYQWTKGGVALPGQTAATLTLAGLQAADAATYACVVTSTLNGTVTTATSASAVLAVNLPPTISTQPNPLQTFLAGNSATFAVVAAGNGTLSYQWTKGGANLPGQTAASLVLSALTPADSATYACIVTNTLGGTATTTTSANAVLQVNGASITAQPTAQTTGQGGSATFTVAATSTGTLSYQWTKGGVNLAGATQASLTLTNCQAADAGSYACLVSSTLGSTTAHTASSAVALNVVLTPVITGQSPAAQTFGQGGRASVWVAAEGFGTGALSYQWSKDGVALPGATAASYSVASVQPGDAGSYACVVTSTLNGVSAPTAASTATVLAVNPTPVITAQPVAVQTILGAAPASLTVAATTGAGTLSYQWLKAGTAIAGATAATYTIPSVSSASAGTYTCVVSSNLNNTTASITSAASVLYVNMPSSVSLAPAATQTVAAGGTAVIVATPSAAGTVGGTFSYQWNKTGVAIPGATGNILTLSNLQPADGASYTCDVTYLLNGVSSLKTSTASAVVVNAPPVITAQPTASQDVAVGGGTTLTVAATAGSGATSYQWRKDGSAITGATAASYVLSNATLASAGSYTCLVTSTLTATTASVASSPALVTVAGNQAPAFTTNLASAATFPAGSPGTFTIAATGAGTLTYQWTKGGAAIAGATSASYTIPSVAATDAGTYACAVTSTSGTTVTSATSNSEVVTVNAAPTVSALPATATFLLGGNLSLTCNATTTAGTLSYQWLKAGLALPGQVLKNLVIANVQPGDAGSYTCLVTNTLNGTTTSTLSTATVMSVVTAPVITSSPASLTAHQGDSVAFTVAATGNGTLTYQWSLNGAAVAGATAATLAIPSVANGNAGTYTCTVSNTINFNTLTATSAAAVLEVDPSVALPVVTIDPFITANATDLVASTQDQGAFVTYAWVVTGGTPTSPLTGRTVTYTAPPSGSVTATVTVTSALNSQQGTATASVLSFAGPDLSLPAVVHPGDAWMTAMTSAHAGETYLWSVLPGTGTGSITGSAANPTAAFAAASGDADGSAFQVQVNAQHASDSSNASNAATVTVRTGVWVSKDHGPVATVGANPAATVLANGRVLITGGNGAAASAAATIYDPATGQMLATGAMNVARYQHTTTLLDNGMVLAAGGLGLNSAELWDPATGTWTLLAQPMSMAHGMHTAVKLADGRVALIGGRQDGSSTYAPVIDIFDPASLTWSAATPALLIPRYGHTATLLGNGLILIAGGTGGYGSGATLAASQCELFNPTAAAINGIAPLSCAPSASLTAKPRTAHTATRLNDGTVLLAGGTGGATFAELYNPATDSFSLLANTIKGSPVSGNTAGRSNHTATLLGDGTVLLAGGNTAAGTYWSLDVYNPSTQTFTNSSMPGVAVTAVPPMGNGHYSHAAAALPSGQAVVVGGSNTGTTGTSTVELFTPPLWTAGAITTPGAVSVPAGLDQGRIYFTATPLLDGRVMVVGGTGSQTGINGTVNMGYLTTARIYDPVTHAWSATGSTNQGHSTATAVRLANGDVLVAGGYGPGNGTIAATAELWDHVAGTWTFVGSMTQPRIHHAMALLQDGRVLVMGGDNYSNFKSCELYDPVAKTFTATIGSMSEAKEYLTPVVLGDGRVAIAGGSLSSSSFSSLVEIFSPATQLWTALPTALTSARGRHAAVLLANGHLLLAGGQIASAGVGGVAMAGAEAAPGPYSTVEEFDPSGSGASLGLSPAPFASGPRTTPFFLPLAGGKYLFFGGTGALSSNPTSADVYDSVAGTFTATGAMTLGRTGGSDAAATLPNGDVLVIGGTYGDASTEIYRPK